MPPKRKAKKAAAPKAKRAKTANKGATQKGLELEITKAVESHKTGFLDLPAELRNQIYGLALSRKYDITIPDRKEVVEFSNKHGVRAPPVVVHEPTMLALCRQVRREALPYFYGCNTFTPRFALYGPKLVRQLGPERTAMLAALKVCGTEQAQYVTVDRFMHAAIKHANRLLEVADGALSISAVLMPLGHAATGGWQKLTDAKDLGVVEDDEEVHVEWLGEKLEPAFSIWEY